jgi:Uma2 family endonuclease
MSTIPHHTYTLEEYIELDKNTEGRWEYFAGEVVDMAGGSLEHNQIVSNMVRVLGNQLADRGCRVLSSDMRLKVPKAFPYRYPDAVVVCDEPILEELQGQPMLVNPLLIVEVLSASTEGYDRGFKFTAYQSIASFQEYVLVAQDRPHITRYVRQADGQWLRSEVEGLEGVLELVSVSCTLALSDVYRFVNFPPRASDI